LLFFWQIRILRLGNRATENVKTTRIMLHAGELAKSLVQFITILNSQLSHGMDAQQVQVRKSCRAHPCQVRQSAIIRHLDSRLASRSPPNLACLEWVWRLLCTDQLQRPQFNSILSKPSVAPVRHPTPTIAINMGCAKGRYDSWLYSMLEGCRNEGDRVLADFAVT
jgi:hypothetical protein